jgi:hypothetical protein
MEHSRGKKFGAPIRRGRPNGVDGKRPRTVTDYAYVGYL